MRRSELLSSTAKALDKAQMTRFDVRSGSLSATDLGRTASHYYVRSDTVLLVNEKYHVAMTEADILALVSESAEFENIRVRDEEMAELDGLLEDCCVCEVKVQKPQKERRIVLNIDIQNPFQGRRGEPAWQGEYLASVVH